MKAHLARHMSSTHGVKPAGAGKKKTGKKRLGRPKGSKNKVPKNLGVPLRSGRPTALVVKLGIRDMSIDELTQVIDAARDEARRRLADLQAALG
jgi:hypothetical protein